MTAEQAAMIMMSGSSAGDIIGEINALPVYSQVMFADNYYALIAVDFDQSTNTCPRIGITSTGDSSLQASWWIDNIYTDALVYAKIYHGADLLYASVTDTSEYGAYIATDRKNYSDYDFDKNEYCERYLRFHTVAQNFRPTSNATLEMGSAGTLPWIKFPWEYTEITAQYDSSGGKIGETSFTSSNYSEVEFAFNNAFIYSNLSGENLANAIFNVRMACAKKQGFIT